MDSEETEDEAKYGKKGNGDGEELELRDIGKKT